LKLLFSEHHLSHAASAFYCSPFEEAAILTIDGVGEWATTSIGVGKGNSIRFLREIHFPHSLGLLYSAFTYFCGFKVNSGEYKLMGLAPYGDETSERFREFKKKIGEHLVTVYDDGSFFLHQDYFDYLPGLRMARDRKWEQLFGLPRRAAETGLDQAYCDLALAIQRVTEDVILRLAGTARRLTGCARVVLAGGVALNCVANGKLVASGLFEDVFIQPAAGDAGGALGEGNIVGWFQGRMEFGPRALGHRSILADARDVTMQRRLNLSTKFREDFRPFAPICRVEKAADYIDGGMISPYMLLTARLAPQYYLPLPEGYERLGMEEKLKVARSRFPAVTHVDGSARWQTVARANNPQLWALLAAFETLTGEGILINTSMNVRGEPIVCSPEEALACFKGTGIDVLVLENIVIFKKDQPGAGEWQQKGAAAAD
jgi:predicted NodU family carbamoyl transferase